MPDLVSEGLALLFAEEASRALALGPLRGYRTEDQILPVVRVRLRIRDQELCRFGMLVPLEVTVDEWTTDMDENRRVRAAARRLLALPGVLAAIRAGLVRIDRLLAEAWLALCRSHPHLGIRRDSTHGCINYYGSRSSSQ